MVEVADFKDEMADLRCEILCRKGKILRGPYFFKNAIIFSFLILKPNRAKELLYFCGEKAVF
jgi:hypothetical protein